MNGEGIGGRPATAEPPGEHARDCSGERAKGQATATVAGKGYDCSILDIEIADKVRDVADRIRRRAKDSYISVGRDLIAVKDMLGHGRFGTWLLAEFGWTSRTAQNFMAAAQLVDANPRNISFLPPTAIYGLAAPSTPETVRQEIVARVEAGETLSVKEVAIAITEGKEREAKHARLEAEKDRLARLSPSARRQRQKKKEQREREEKEVRLKQERAEEAAKEAVELLVEKLGPSLARFMRLANTATFYRIERLLRAKDFPGCTP